jgi:sulfoxide reductase heme-binding subunit YedZ
MRLLKANWKKLQSLVYAVIFLSLLHVALLDKTWLIYAIIVGLGFVVRIPVVKKKFFELRKQRKKRKKAKRNGTN